MGVENVRFQRLDILVDPRELELRASDKIFLRLCCYVEAIIE